MIWMMLGLAFILRLIGLNQSFWLDEATTATLARDFSFGEILTKFAPGDFHPPLYYLLTKAWSIPFGVSEVTLRLLSVLFGLMSVYVVYLLGAKLSKTVGMVAGLLLATAPLHIYYSQEARMYALSTLLVSLLVFSFVKTIKSNRVGEWLIFGVILAILGMTDYLPLFIIPIFWIYGFLSKQAKSWWIRLAMSHIILLGVGLLWWPTLRQQLAGGLGVATSLPGWWNILGKTSLKEMALLPVKFMVGRVGFANKAVYGLVVGLVGGLFGYLILKAKKTLKKHLLIWLWLVVPVGLAALVGLALPVFSYFRLTFVLPAFYLLVAVGLAQVKKDLFAPLLLLVLSVNIIFSCMYLLNPKFQREDWRGAVEAIGDSPTIFPSEGQQEAFRYYGGRVLEINELGADDKEVWLMRYVYEVVDPIDATREKIEELGYNKTLEQNFNGVVVWKYTR